MLSPDVTTGAPAEAPAAPEPPVVPAADAPRSPGEAVDRYSQQAAEITAEETPAPAPEPVEWDATLEEDPLLADLPEGYVDGYREALTEAGLYEPTPADPGYADWATQEIARVSQETNDLAIAAIAALTGSTPERVAAQFAAEEAAHEQHQLANYQAVTETGLSHAAQVAEDIGAPYVDPAGVLELARQTRAEVERQYGPEVASNLTDAIYERVADHLAGEFEQVAQHGLDLVKEVGSYHGEALDREKQLDALEYAEQIFPRRLREANGDADAATEQAFADGVRHVAGGPQTPRQVTEFHNKRIRRMQELERGRAAEKARAGVVDPPSPTAGMTKSQLLDHYAAQARRLALEGT